MKHNFIKEIENRFYCHLVWWFMDDVRRRRRQSHTFPKSGIFLLLSPNLKQNRNSCQNSKHEMALCCLRGVEIHYTYHHQHHSSSYSIYLRLNELKKSDELWIEAAIAHCWCVVIFKRCQMCHFHMIRLLWYFWQMWFVRVLGHRCSINELFWFSLTLFWAIISVYVAIVIVVPSQDNKWTTATNPCSFYQRQIHTGRNEVDGYKKKNGITKLVKASSRAIYLFYSWIGWECIKFVDIQQHSMLQSIFPKNFCYGCMNEYKAYNGQPSDECLCVIRNFSFVNMNEMVWPNAIVCMVNRKFGLTFDLLCWSNAFRWTAISWGEGGGSNRWTEQKRTDVIFPDGIFSFELLLEHFEYYIWNLFVLHIQLVW